jgi:hypothetical protein
MKIVRGIGFGRLTEPRTLNTLAELCAGAEAAVLTKH